MRILNKTLNNKKIHLAIIIIFILITFAFPAIITACRQKAPEIETFSIQRGNIIESVSATGSVDSAEIKNYGVKE